MKKWLIALVGLCMYESVCAQATEEFLVRAGEEASDIIPRVQHFYYPTFQEGQIFYPQGKRSDVLLLNYNTLVGVMQYIDPSGDTLFIPEESNIFKYVRIGKDIFYHHFREGYFNLHSRDENYNLASRTRWRIERRDVMVDNGYGMSAATPGSTISTMKIGEAVVANQDMSYTSETEFFLVGPRDAVFHATRTGVLKAFPDYNEQMQAFIRDHQTNFDDAQSLKDLINYGNGLIAAEGTSLTYKPKGN